MIIYELKNFISDFIELLSNKDLLSYGIQILSELLELNEDEKEMIDTLFSEKKKKKTIDLIDTEHNFSFFSPDESTETNDENTKYSARYSSLFFIGTWMTSFLWDSST